ncbi:hypothetical protein GF324_01195, partial [bacterium]|nr:hypothetical protein [bacterium]
MVKTQSSSILVLLILVVCNTHGSIYHVPEDFTSINAAIEQAAERDTILLEEGFYNEQVILDKSLTLASLYILDQDTTHIGATTLVGTDTLGSEGSTIRILQSEELNQVRIAGLRFIDAFVTGTSPDYGKGGAIFYYPDSLYGLDLLIDHNHFENNTADYGGAIYLSFANGTITHNTFVMNSAFLHGGACFLVRSDIDVTGNRFESNEAVQYVGGALQFSAS